MTHGYTAWHAIARLLDDIALILRTLRTDRDAPPRHTSESAPMADFRAGSDFRAGASEREVGEKHTADAFCPTANDNCSAASAGNVLSIYVECSLGCDIDLSFAGNRPASS